MGALQSGDHTAGDRPPRTTSLRENEALPSGLSFFSRFGLLDGSRHLCD